MDSNRQLTLFTTTDLSNLTTRRNRCGKMQMDGNYLQNWKAKIQKHQHSCQISPPIEQATLFDLGSTDLKPETIDPFTLTLHSFSFFRLPASEPGNACIYFVLDTAAEIDGRRPVDRSELEVRDTVDIDGIRPIVASGLEVSDILNIDGQRPIAKSNFQEHDTLDIDGSRPVDPSVLEIRATLDIDGSRPIASNHTENPEIPDDYID